MERNGTKTLHSDKLKCVIFERLNPAQNSKKVLLTFSKGVRNVFQHVS